MTGSHPSAGLVSTVLLLAGVSMRADSAGVPVPPPSLALRYDQWGALEKSSPKRPEDVVRASQNATHVFVLSHGSHGSVATAKCRYERLESGILAQLRSPSGNEGIRPVFVELYWPSAVVAPQDDCGNGAESAPQAAADAFTQWAQAAYPEQRSEAFRADLRRLSGLFAKESAGTALTSLEGLDVAKTLGRWHLASTGSQSLPEWDGPGDVPLTSDAAQAASRWEQVPSWSRGPQESLVDTPWLDYVNVFAFWTMKERAGLVGRRGVNDLLKALESRRRGGLRVHLIGHSFGAKLLAAALTGDRDDQARSADSLVLLQGTLSGFAFATAKEITDSGVSSDRAGRYTLIRERPLVGALVATFSRQDRANRYLYPLGSALAGGETFDAVKPSRVGSLGGTGFQGFQPMPLLLAQRGRMSVVDKPEPPTGTPYIINVDASDVILSHGDYLKDPVYAVIVDAVVAADRRLGPVPASFDGGVRVDDVSKPPWNTICRITVRGRDGSVIQGTGFLVSDRLVLTAAHQLLDTAPASVEVLFALNGDAATARRYAVSTLRFPSEWAKTRDPSYDIAAVVLSTPAPGPYLEPLVIDPRAFPGREIAAAGYALGAPYLLWTSGQVLGIETSRVAYDLSTSPGMGGSPVWSTEGTKPNTVSALHIGRGLGGAAGQDGLRLTPEGLPFTPRLLALIQAWIRDAR